MLYSVSLYPFKPAAAISAVIQKVSPAKTPSFDDAKDQLYKRQDYMLAKAKTHLAWRMTKGKVLEGVFGTTPSPPSPSMPHSLTFLFSPAINKPTGLSSAQVLRDLQTHFNPSTLFAPYLASEKAKRDRENKTQRRRRRDKSIQVKIGHGGTLDPLATGVLIAGVGKGTKALQDFLLCTKQYETVVVFGASTDTYDRLGKVLRRAPYEHVMKEVVEKALGAFRGRFMQLPPLFSALKMDGKPLYEYAREGKPIPRQIERRQVDVLELEMVEWMEPGTHEHKAPEEMGSEGEIKVANQVWEQEKVLPAGDVPKKEGTEEEKEFESKKRKLSNAQDELVFERPVSKQQRTSSQEPTMSGGLDPTPPSSSTPQSENSDSKGPPAVRLRMTVTSGFYVRSLAHDLGAAVGSAACMTELERTRQGEFELGTNVLEYSDLARGEEVWGSKVEGMIDKWNAKREKAVVEEKRERSPSVEDSKVVKEEGPPIIEDKKVKEEEPPAEEEVAVEHTDEVTSVKAVKAEAS